VTREEVLQIDRDSIASYAKEAAGVSPAIKSMESPESRGGAFRLIARIVGLGSEKPTKQQEAIERLDEKRRFMSYVESVLTGRS
jgi:hypothetical protein